MKYKFTSKDFIYPAVMLFILLVPVARYYASTPGINDCVADYVDKMEESDYRGYIYDINGVRHMEPVNSNVVKSIEQYKIGESKGCIMSSGNILNDLNNTFYCSITYLIKNAPIHENSKQPLALLDNHQRWQ